METLRELFITLGLDADEASFATAEAAVKGLEKAGELLIETFKMVGEQLIETVLSTAEYADNLDDASKRTGIATDDLQALGFAAAQSGSSFEGIQTGLSKLSVLMGKAASGSAEAGQGFADLGIAVRDGNGDLKSSREVFLEVADKLKGITNETDKTSKAEAVLGKSFRELMPLMADGADGIKTLMQQAEDLGLVMDSKTVESVAEFNDMLSAGAAVMKSFRNEVGVVLIRALKPLAEMTLNWVAANRKLLTQRLEQFATALVNIGTTLARVIAAIAEIVGWMTETWERFGIIAGAAFALLLATSAEAVIAVLAVAAPVFLLVGLFGILALAVEDVWVALHGGDSLIGELGPKWTKFLSDWTSSPSEWWVIDRLKAAIDLLTKLSDLIPTFDQSWGEAFKKSDFARSVFGAPLSETVPHTFSPQSDASMVAAGSGGGTLAPQMSANFVIQGAGNPQETATAVSTAMDDWWSKKLGPTKNAVQGG